MIHIKCLHSIFFNELNNILSLISHQCIFKFSVNRVGTFKRMNVKLQTFKLSKNRSNRMVFFSYTKFRSSLTMPWNWFTQSALIKIPICAKAFKFFMSSHLKILRGFLSRFINFLSKIRRWGMHTSVSKKKKTPR